MPNSMMRTTGCLGLSIAMGVLFMSSMTGPVSGADAYRKVQTSSFAMEIPSDWTTKQGNPDWYASPPKTADSVSFSVRSGPFKGTLSEYVKYFKAEMQDSLNRSEILEEKTATVAGQPAATVDTRGPCVAMPSVPDGFYTCRARCWIFVKNHIGYQIMGSANLDISKYEKTFVRMVGSFTPTGK